MLPFTRFLPSMVLGGSLLLGLFASGCNDWPALLDELEHRGGTSTPSKQTDGGARPTDGGPTPTSQQCMYEGKLIPEGSVVGAPDGCNQCVCKGGNLACTEKACPPPPPPTGCVWDGKLYTEGSMVPPQDSCRTCFCKDGKVVCSEGACPPPPPTGCVWEGKLFPEGSMMPPQDSCNTCYCKAGAAVCTSNMCPPPPVATGKDCLFEGKPNDCSPQ